MADLLNHRSREVLRSSPDSQDAKTEPAQSQLGLYDIAYYDGPCQSIEQYTDSFSHHMPTAAIPRTRTSSQAKTPSASSTASAPKQLTFKEFVSPAAARKSKHERHSRQEWESRKDTIHKLYIEEGRPLRDVMKVMEEGGFKATTKMYKLRLAEWEFNKNNRERDIAAMLQVQGQRSAAGKPTTFRRHGKPVQIDAYLRRKGIDVSNFPANMLVDQRQLPTYIRQLTPPPSVSHSGSTLLQELLFQCFRDLAWKRQASIGSGVSWVIEKSRYVGTPTMNALRDMYDADCLFAQGLPKLGGTVCERSFRSLHHLVLDPTLEGFCHLVTNLQRMRSPDIGKETWKYLSGYARAVQAAGPIRPLLEHIEKLFDSNRTGTEERQDFIADCIDKILLSDELEVGFPASTITQLYPFMFQIPMLQDAVDPRFQRLQRLCDVQRLEHLRGLQRGFSMTPEPQPGSPPIKAEEIAPAVAMMKRLQAEEEAFFESLHLLMVGDQSNWLSPEVTNLCTSILARASDPQFEGGYYAYNAYKALALVNRVGWDKEQDALRVDDAAVVDPATASFTTPPISPLSGGTSPYQHGSSYQSNPSKLELAISFLEKAISILSRWTESETLLLDDLTKLNEWSREAGDFSRAATADSKRAECISTLLEKSMVLEAQI